MPCTTSAIRIWLTLLVLAGCCADSLRAQSPLHSTATQFRSISQLFSAGGSIEQPTVWRPPAQMPYVDLDQQYPVVTTTPVGAPHPSDCWQWQLLPRSIIYPSYLAGQKEPRFAAQIINAREDGWLFDASLGTRIGLFRFGSTDPIRPDGWQLDAEGAAQLRLDIPEEVDVRSADFRGGVPLTFGDGPSRFKIGYYHLSSHLGDEFMLKNPGFERLNYSRDALLVGHMFYVTEELRVYGEATWAFKSEISEPWEFQFGLDFLPPGPTGLAGAPFFALNGHLRQELDFGGSFTAQAGIAWRAMEGTHMLRAGLHYFNGESSQYSFFDQHEEQLGFGLWYDF